LQFRRLPGEPAVQRDIDPRHRRMPSLNFKRTLSVWPIGSVRHEFTQSDLPSGSCRRLEAVSLSP
jgi:hypothetical protein